MLKVAFLVGAQYGQGVVTCRTGHGWSAPVFIRMAGGSFGFQAGGTSTDLILIAVNERGFQDLLKSGIIDPAKVARTALLNAASVAGLALTTDVLLTELKEGDEKSNLVGGAVV